MARPKRRRRKARPRSYTPAVGAPPGTLEAPPGAVDTTVRIMTFDEGELDELEGFTALENAPRRRVTWIDVVGLGSVTAIRAIGEKYDLHALALEDVTHTRQRPKVEQYPDHLFIVMRATREKEGGIDIEQISMFVGDGFVITFQEREGDAYEPVRDRIRGSRGIIRTQDASYLCYALIDATVDAMFPLLELYEHRLDQLDERVFKAPGPELAEEIHDVSRDLMTVRRTVLPTREALMRLVRDRYPQFGDEVKIYLRDCLDHLDQLVDLLTGQRDLAEALANAHLSGLGHRSNEVMKVLTMTATIFIPLSFICGLYGMNFDPGASPYNMPELGWEYGYPAALGVMLSVGLGMLAFFRRKGWL